MLRIEDAAGVLRRSFGVEASGVDAASTRFVAFAGQDGLRWIIPADRGVGRRVLADWTPYKPASKLAWRAVRGASRLGVLAFVPGAHPLRAALGDVDWSKFGWSRPDAPHVVAYAGTIGPHQKLVCTLIDRQTSEGVLVVKFPVVESAKIWLRQEFTNLTQLTNEGRDIGPRPLLIDGQARFTVQSYLHGRPDGTTISEGHLDFLAGLVQAGRKLELGVVRDELVAQRDEQISSGVLSGDARATIDDALCENIWRGSIPAVRLHGDFAPWNLKRSADGAIRAVDWERSAIDELPYLDLHHFRRQIMEGLGRACAVPWRAYTAILMRADPELSCDTANAALTAAAIRYWLTSGWMGAWGDWAA